VLLQDLTPYLSCASLPRQSVFDGLGHEPPTFLLTNDLPERLIAREVIQTYARRNHIEH
jgi:hypothetical protein